MTALAVAVGCALPPLLQLGRVPPARVLRSDLDPPPLRYLTIYGVAALAVMSLLYVLFGDFELIAYLSAGAVAMFGLLYFAGRLLVSLLQRVRGRVGVAWRYGIANVARRGRESSVQVVAFGIGLMVLLLLTSVRTQLMSQWRATLPASAPNHFFINIQPEERDAIGAALVAYGVGAPTFTPLVRARITHVNGRPVAEFAARSERGRRELDSELNVTWRDTLGTDNEIVAGEWHGAAATAPRAITRGRHASRDRARDRRRDHVLHRRRAVHGKAHERPHRALGLVPAELLHGVHAGRRRAVRAHVHHEPLRSRRRSAA